MVTIITSVLQILLRLVPLFIKKEEDKAKVKAKIQDAFKGYETGVTNAADVRTQQQDLQGKLNAEYDKVFKKP